MKAPTHHRKKVVIFTDGACSGNPGPGGWGALLRYGEHEKKISGATADTTNNRMELTAVIKALELLKESCDVDITTDSSYVSNGITKYLPHWKKNGWKTAAKQPVKNSDLWHALDTLVHHHHIKWHWVKGHSGHNENEIVDKLATAAIKKFLEKNSC